MEALLTHAKPRLVRLTAFRVGPRPERRTGRVRDEILAVLPELVGARVEFTMNALMTRLNPGNEDRRQWAVEKAVRRLARSVSGTEASTLRRCEPGRYWWFTFGRVDG